MAPKIRGGWVDWGDKTSVLEAMTCGYDLWRASEPLRDDKDVVLFAVKNNGRALHAS